MARKMRRVRAEEKSHSGDTAGLRPRVLRKMAAHTTLGIMQVGESTPPCRPAGRALDLTGKFLIAMPGLGDPRFDRAVILLCRHTDEGAMGLIVNKPLPEVSLSALLGQLSIDHSPDSPDLCVHAGGPVGTGRGFVVHTPDWQDAEASIKITLSNTDPVMVSATLDVLRALAAGTGPRAALITLGYAGWAADQLEAEIGQNVWLIADAAPTLMFDTPAPLRWAQALALLGIDPRSLSATAGRA